MFLYYLETVLKKSFKTYGTHYECRKNLKIEYNQKWMSEYNY